MGTNTAILHHPQPRVDREAIGLRLHLAKTYVDLTRTLARVAYRDRGPRMSAQTLLVLLGVFIGDGEGRPMSASKLAHFTGMPRATVYRHLEILLKIKKIERSGRYYRYGRDVMNPDPSDSLSKILDRLCKDLIVHNGR